MAKRGYRPVGMCSMSRSFSAFSCSGTVMFDDFYIEPVFRREGVVCKPVQTAQNRCKRSGITSLIVCFMLCDDQIYQNLGFDVALGHTYAYLI